MRVVCDIEANGLEAPTEVWVICCLDIDTGDLHTFRKVTTDVHEKIRFLDFSRRVTRWIGHNFLGYDYRVLKSLLGLSIDVAICIDTLIISQLVNFSRPQKHSLEAYGIQFGLPKLPFSDFTQYTPEMEVYCARDTEVCRLVYEHYAYIVGDVEWQRSIQMEHKFQLVCNALHSNGFAFNSAACRTLLAKITEELEALDKEILNAFPPTLHPLKLITPKITRHGTLSKVGFKFVVDGDLSTYNGGPFTRCEWRVFNPSSTRQVVEVLNKAGWRPVNKTKTHIQVERELLHVERSPISRDALALKKQELYNKLLGLKKTGWKVDEKNLESLPKDAPTPARTLAKRILLESRRRTLVEWLSLVQIEIRLEKTNVGEIGIIKNINPTLNGLTVKEIKRKSGEKIILKKPALIADDCISSILTDCRSKTLLQWLNSKNINARFVKENVNYVWIIVTGQDKLEDFYAALATVVSDGLKQNPLKLEIISTRIRGQFQGIGAWTGRMAHRHPNTANIPTHAKLYGAEMRSLWHAPKKRLLVGVDAEAIQLRIFAHYINDEEFTNALVNGRKEDKTDPHSVNQRVLGSVCKSRAVAKRFIFALLLGAGIGKLAEILECASQGAQQALDRLIQRYPGLQTLRETIIPRDSEQGWFRGLDGRKVPIPGASVGSRRHLAMSGYLQNGEALVMKYACILWCEKLCPSIFC